jgi:hypothetical protein
MFAPRRLACLFLGVLWTFCNQSFGCLRSSLDDRAVQWSTLIVRGTILSAAPVIPFQNAATTRPTTQPVAGYEVFQFQVGECLDGHAKPGEAIRVIRFLTTPEDQSSLCGQGQVKDQIGKSFVLLLRPENQLIWSKNPSDPDPRTPQIHDLKAFVIVHLESTNDLGKEGLADLKYTISDTRAAEAAFDKADAKVQAQTLVRAADETEADQAEHALLEMGPKAVEMLRRVSANANDQGRARLGRVIDAVSPPPLNAADQPDAGAPDHVQ